MVTQLRLPFRLALLATALVALAGVASAADNVPRLIQHQGRIAVSGTDFIGTGHFRFALIDWSSGIAGPVKWYNDGTALGAAQPVNACDINVAGGLYSVALGDTSIANMTAIPSSIFLTCTDVRLRIWFDDGTVNGIQKLSPDVQLTASGFALRASSAASVDAVPASALPIAGTTPATVGGVYVDNATITVAPDGKLTVVGGASGNAGGDLSGTYPNPTITNGAVTSAKIADGTIANIDVAANAAIDATKLANGSVSNADFQALSGVTGGNLQTQLTGKVANGGGVPALLAGADGLQPAPAAGNLGWLYYASDTGILYRSTGAGGAWLPLTVADGAVTTAKLAASAVTNAKVAANAVDTANLVNGSVTNAKVAANAVDTANLVNGSVTTAKIAAGAVTTTEIANGTIMNVDVNANAAIDATKIANGSVSNTDFQALSGITGGNVQTQLTNKVANAGGAPSLQAGLDGSKPAAAAGNTGFLYYGTDTSILYRSTGAAWVPLTVADGAVTTAKLADANVTTAKIAPGAVTTTEIANATIVDADVSGTAAIAGTKIVAGSNTVRGTVQVDGTTITDNGSGVIGANVGTGPNQLVRLDGSSKLPAVDGSQLTGVVASGIADGAVTTAKIADANVTNAKLAAMPNNTIKGNVSGGAASPSDLTATQVAGVLPVLRSDTSSTLAGGSGSTLALQSDLSAANRSTDLVSISQVNDATHNQTAGSLLAVTQSDTASATAAVTLGNAGSGAALNITSGALTTAGNISQSGAATFTTGSGAVSLNGDTTIANGKSFSQAGGGTFGTGTGPVSLNGDTTLAAGKSLTLAAGTTTAPALVLTSGATLTSAAAGAVEWDGSRMYLTQTAGPTRKTVAYTSDFSGANSGDVTLAGENYLTIASQVITAHPVDVSGSNITGTLAAANFPALGGDVTTSAGSLTTAIGANKVLDTMLRTGAATSVIGRSANSIGNVADIAAASDGQVLRRAAGALGFGTIDAAAIGSGTLGVTRGGTGVGAVATGDILIGTAANTLSALNGNTTASTTKFLSSTATGGGAATAPVWAGLQATDIPSLDAGKITTGTLGVALGGTGTATAFTQGSVVFAGAAGAYAQDNANLFYDATNHQLALGGTTAPAASRAALYGGGLFIGASDPTSCDAALMMNTAYGGFRRMIQEINLQSATEDTLNLTGSINTNTQQWFAWGVDSGYRWRIQPGTDFTGAPAFVINSSGQVGVGTAAPGWRADIADGGAAIKTVMRLQNTTAGGNNNGVRMRFGVNDSNGAMKDVAAFGALAPVDTAGAQVGDLAFWAVDEPNAGAGTLAQMMGVRPDLGVDLFSTTSSLAINLNSKVNRNSDRGFLLWQDDSANFWNGAGSNENGRLTLGVANDIDSGNGEELWLQGGARLVQNVGTWDAELNTIVGAQGGGLTGGQAAYQWRVNNVATMTMLENGKLGINQGVPAAMLHIGDNGTAAGAPMLEVGDDSFFTDVDQANTLALYGIQNNSLATLQLGSAGGGISGKTGFIGIDQADPRDVLDVLGGGIFRAAAPNVPTTIGSYTHIGFDSASGWGYIAARSAGSYDQPLKIDAAPLYLNAASTGNVSIAGGGGAVTAGYGANDVQLGISSGKVKIGTGTGDVQIVTGSGKAGVGTATPAAKLDVVGTTRLGDSANNYVAVAANGAMSFAGTAKPKRTTILAAASATLPVAGGPTPAQTDGANFSFATVDFAHGATQFACWQFAVPGAYDPATLTADVTISWFSDGIVGDAKWQVEIDGKTTAAAFDTALRAAVSATSTANTTADALQTATLPGVTTGWAAGRTAIVKVTRLGGDVQDTLVQAARLVQVTVVWKAVNESD